MTRRRAPRRSAGTVVPLVAFAVIAGALGWMFVGDQHRSEVPGCASAEAVVAGQVAGYTGEQLEHAATIMRAGAREGFGLDGQRLGVMAAMGESGLRNLDYGDWETSGVRNPDGTRTTSIGLFQQQEWWGTVEERMDPARAAQMFFVRLAVVDDWEQLNPSHAIHRVQVNQNPDHYSRWDEASHEVAEALHAGCVAG